MLIRLCYDVMRVGNDIPLVVGDNDSPAKEGSHLVDRVLDADPILIQTVGIVDKLLGPHRAGEFDFLSEFLGFLPRGIGRVRTDAGKSQGQNHRETKR